MFNPGYALFQPQAADALTYQPNKVCPCLRSLPSHLLISILVPLSHRRSILNIYHSSNLSVESSGKLCTIRDSSKRTLVDVSFLRPSCSSTFLLLMVSHYCAAVYKHMLGKSVDHRDLESIDPEYFKSLVWMLENDIDGVLDLTFSVERDDFGVSKVVDLIPDGRNIVVTNENKAEYVRLIADQRLSIDIKDQMTVRFCSSSVFLESSADG